MNPGAGLANQKFSSKRNPYGNERTHAQGSQIRSLQAIPTPMGMSESLRRARKSEAFKTNGFQWTPKGIPCKTYGLQWKPKVILCNTKGIHGKTYGFQLKTKVIPFKTYELQWNPKEMHSKTNGFQLKTKGI